MGIKMILLYGICKCCRIIFLLLLMSSAVLVSSITKYPIILNIRLPHGFYPPCTVVSFSRNVTRECKKLSDVTKDHIPNLEIYLSNIEDLVTLKEKERIRYFQQLPNATFGEIHELGDPENIQNISMYLNASTKPEEFLHKNYARILIWSAYVNSLRNIPNSKSPVLPEGFIDQLLNETMRTACRFEHFAEELGIKPFQRQIAEFSHTHVVEHFSDLQHVVGTILENGKKSLKVIQEHLCFHLNNDLLNCRLKCKDKRKRSLKCKQSDSGSRRAERHARKSAERRRGKGKKKNRRRHRKGKKGRKNRRRNRKQRKGRFQ